MLKKAKTHKGRKILKEREPQAVEGSKKSLFIKGTKTKEKTSSIMKELFALKKKDSLFLNKSKLDVKPFESCSKLEHICSKHECAMFAFGCDQKKRPHNLIIGRIYEGSILDMIEFGIENYESLKQKIKQVQIPLFAQPVLSFQGDVFEYDVNFMRIKNLLIGLLDFFANNFQIKQLDLNKELTHIISFSTNEQKIFMRVYQIIKTEEDDAFSLQELGPNCDLVIRRHQLASDDQFKQACKKLKPKKKKEEKNVYHNALGNKMGKIYIEQENLNSLGLKKRKKVKKNSEKEQIKNENESSNDQ